MADLVLELPAPPSPNTRPRHPMAMVRWKNKTKADTWTRAVQQCRPFTDPPQRVRVTAHFRLWNLRDEDNLYASLKATLDALKQNQPTTDNLKWRHGVCECRGYFWDDSPKHLTLEKPTQKIDRKNRGLTLAIEVLEAA